MADTREVIKAVAETRERMVREMDAPASTGYGSPPPPVDPLSIPPEVVDECFGLDQLGDAELLIWLFKNRYLRDNNQGVSERDKFKNIYRYVGSHWAMDTSKQFLRDFMAALGEVYRIRADMFLAELTALTGMETVNQARHMLKLMGKDASDEQVDLLKRGEAYLARAKKCLAVPRALHAADLAFSGADSLGFNGDWNAHPTWLPCPNGTVDLATGLIMEPRPEHFFNRCLDVEYRGLNAPCPVWREAVRQIFYDPLIIDYVEHVCGVAATGIQTKDFFIFFGPRANNGKSLFFGALARVLGPFCEAVDVDMLLRQSQRSASVAHPEMLRLRYVRFAIFQEADSLDTFDAGKVKHMTSGGDEISIRTLHSEIYHKFCQIHSVALHTNKTPRIYGADRGLAGRIKVIPCESEFIDPALGPADPENRIFQARDRVEMNRTLEAEMSGILGWLAGCAMKFLANSRRLPPPPPEVAAESSEFMIENDLVSQFLAARALWGEEYSIRGQSLHHCFSLWCENERDMKPKDIMNATVFGREMKNHVKKKKRDKDGIIYLGLTITMPPEPKSSADDLDAFMGMNL